MSRTDKAEKSSSLGAGLLRVTAVGLVFIAFGAWGYGSFTHRWGGGPDAAQAAAALDDFPESFGHWRQLASNPMDDLVLDTLQCSGYVNRVYLNVDSGEEVRVALIVGPPGPTAVHTPEICYSSRDYEIQEEPVKESLTANDDTHTYWKTSLKSRLPGGSPLIVYYAWAVDGTWNASDSPRYEYGGGAYLYKIQVAGAPAITAKREESDLCERFIRDLLESGWRTGIASIG